MRLKSWIVPAMVLGVAAAGAGKLDGWKQKLIGMLPGDLRAQAEQLEGKITGAPAGIGSHPGEFSVLALRKQLKTTVGVSERDDSVPTPPPAGELELVHYAAPLGSNVAYVTPVKAGARGPAIIWIAGGFTFNVDAAAWLPATRDNDQSGRQFRQAGIATMYPALRGTSQNPGHKECFLGEADDIVAAAGFLAERADVDPKRIYLGGHSTGGTLVLLAAESTDRFRAVFSFGPVADLKQYGEHSCLPSTAGDPEAIPRRPYLFLKEIVSPTFIIEGVQSGNGASFPLLQRYVGTAPIEFVGVEGGTHFSVLAPGLEVIAQAILADTGDKPHLPITPEAIAAQMKR